MSTPSLSFHPGVVESSSLPLIKIKRSGKMDSGRKVTVETDLAKGIPSPVDFPKSKSRKRKKVDSTVLSEGVKENVIFSKPRFETPIFYPVLPPCSMRIQFASFIFNPEPPFPEEAFLKEYGGLVAVDPPKKP